MHELVDYFHELGALNKDNLEIFHNKVRDRDDISVLKDPISGLIILSSIDQASEEYYLNKHEKSEIKLTESSIKTPRLDDNIRRSKDFINFIQHKKWLDFGCGLGGALDEMGDLALEATGLDANLERLEIVKEKGFKAIQDIDEIDNYSLDVITLFHVLEHLDSPKEILHKIKSKLKKGGKCIFEVPHARDIMFNLYDNKKFKDFTFWSEHLVLHTKDSLHKMLTEENFKQIEIKFFQRYSLANHLYWLSKGLPGGQEKWSMFQQKDLIRSYNDVVIQLEQTDTLIAIASA